MENKSAFESSYEMKTIGYISSPFAGKFGLPRQSGLCPSSLQKIYFNSPYSLPEAFIGIEGYSHIWIVWVFSENVRDKISLTVRPPRLGGNVRRGVFATRSPFRPNPIGMSCVKLIGLGHDAVHGTFLEVSGADLMDGTPILDIKPYVPFSDSQPDAIGGFADEHFDDRVEVLVSEEIKQKIPADLLAGLVEALEGDPRPAYHRDPDRVYGFEYAGFEVKFTVRGGQLTVTDAYRKSTDPTKKSKDKK